MTDSLISQRERVMDEVDEMLNKHWPARTDEAFKKNMLTQANKMSLLRDQMKTHAAPVEVARTLRYLGMIYHDLEPSCGHHMLVNAEKSYQAADAELQLSPDEAEQARLNFAWANTIRLLYKEDIVKLTEAKERALTARAYFKESRPEHLDATNELIKSLEQLLFAAQQLSILKDSDQVVQKTHADLHSGKLSPEEAVQKLKGEINKVKRIALDVKEILDVVPDKFRDTPEFKRIQTLLEQLPAGQSMDDIILKELQSRLTEEWSNGKVSGVRQHVLQHAMDRIKKIMTSAESSVEDLAIKNQQIRELMSELMILADKPSYGIPEPAPDTKAFKYVVYASVLKGECLRKYMQTGLAEEEKKEILNITIRLSEIIKNLYEARDNDSAVQVWRDSLLPCALQFRQALEKRHVMLVKPAWKAGDQIINSAAVVYSGPAAVLPVLEEAINYLGLKHLVATPADNYMHERFSNICKAMVTVFDLSGRDSAQRASVALELGIAMTLGKPVIILAEKNTQIPFDVDVSPLLYTDANTLRPMLIDALGNGLMWSNKNYSASGFQITIDEIHKCYPRPNNDVYVDQTLKILEDRSMDALTAGRKIITLLTFLKKENLCAIYPNWKPAYVNVDSLRKVFHVMPFAKSWEKNKQTVKNLIEKKGLIYRRGDSDGDLGETLTPNIIEFIWNEIATASFVIADLTDFGPSVAFELGIALTLGKKTLVVGTPQTINELKEISMISKLRAYDYKDLDALQKEVDRFVDHPDLLN